MSEPADIAVQQGRADPPEPKRPIERLLSDADLTFMAERAWRHAARSWSEARAYQRRHDAHGDAELVAAMLTAEAESAEAAWRRLADEIKRRQPMYRRESPRPE